MTEMLEDAVSEMRKLPASDQDDLATLIFAHLGAQDVRYRLTVDQEAEVKRRLATLASGEARLASDEEVAALWKRCGL